ncbi:MAG TPA: glycine zipper 2TM domain-containing protein [Rhizomicrobium sp.]
MRIRAAIAVVLAGALLLSGCATNGTDSPNNEQTGAVLGTILGAVIGAAIGGKNDRGTGAALGALAGGLLGAGIGSYLDKKEKEQLRSASYKAASAPTGQRIVWGEQEPTSKNHRATRTVAAQPSTASGWVVPEDNAYVNSRGRTCRHLQRVVIKNGAQHQDRVETCMDNSGWVIPGV